MARSISRAVQDDVAAIADARTEKNLALEDMRSTRSLGGLDPTAEGQYAAADDIEEPNTQLHALNVCTHNEDHSHPEHSDENLAARIIIITRYRG